MKKLSKKMMSLFLALLMLVSVLPAGMITAQAEESWLWPVASSTKINCGFYGYSFYATWGGVESKYWHGGIDIGGNHGCAVRAAKSGTVLYASDCSSIPNYNDGGLTVVIKHSNNIYSHYNHLSSISVRAGQSVTQGQEIGKMGATGNATGTHLHFAIATEPDGLRGRIDNTPNSAIKYKYSIDNPDDYIPKKPSISINTANKVPTGTIVTVSWGSWDKNAASYGVKINGTGHTVGKSENKTSYSFLAEGNTTYKIKVQAYGYPGYGHSPDSNEITVQSYENKTVKFYDYDGTLISKQVVPYGSSAKTPTNPPARKGYTFTGWDQAYNNVKSDLTIHATYKINTYTVKFLDKDGNLLGNAQKVKYGQSATPPTDTAAPTGYVFLGWNSEAYKNVYTEAANKTITVQGIYQWENDNLPIVASNATAERKNNGYFVYFDLTNYPTKETRGRAVVSLKTRDGRLVDVTESTAFCIAEDETKSNIEVYVPCDYAATTAEIIVIDSYSSGVPISAMVSATIDQGTMWSDWQDEDPGTQLDVQTRTEYHYRDKEFTTSTVSNTMDGWTLYNTTGAWSNYGAWSNWSRTQPTASDTRQVDTPKTVTDKEAYTITHWYHYWNGGAGWNGDWAPTYHSGYAYHTIDTQDKYYSDIYHNTANYKWWNNYTEDGKKAYGFYDPGNGQLGWSCSKCGVNGQLYYINNTTSVPAVTHQEYRYRDRSWITTYHFYKWKDWRDWSPEAPTANSNREIEQKTVYRYIGDNGGNASAVARTFEGEVDEALAGRQITLYIYGYIGASDFTNYYIGQSTVRDDGSYSFTYKLREEPSTKTGDYTIAIGVEGTTDIMEVGTIEAPKPTYTVNFYDYSGEIIKSDTVTEGDSVDAPELESREGYVFTGWSDSAVNVHANLDIFPTEEVKQYTVTYVDWLNQTVTQECYDYGTELSAPSVVVPEGYTFIGWDCIVDGETALTENMVATALYGVNTYTVEFYDTDNETVIDTQTVDYGEAATLPEDLSEGELVHYGWKAAEDTADYACVDQDMQVFPLYVFKETTPNPIADLSNGVYGTAQTVTLSVDDEDALIYYTTDNTDPKTSSTAKLYKGPFAITSTCVFSYYATSFEKNDSETMYNYYCINDGEYSDWMTLTDLPKDVKNNTEFYEVEQEAGYRYKNLATAAAVEDAINLINDGWTYESEEYTEYTAWQDEPIAIDESLEGFEVDTRETEDPTVKWYQYSHYKYTDNDNVIQYSKTAVDGYDCEYETITLENRLSTAGFVDSTIPYYNYNNERWFSQTKVNGVKTQYRSRYLVQVYSKWSDWSIDSLDPNETREYEEDDVYRYANKDYYLVKINVASAFADSSIYSHTEGTETAPEYYQIVGTGKQINLSNLETYYTGYDLIGLFYDDAFTQPYDTSSAVTNSLALYANYTAKTYTVVFQMPDETEIDTQTVSYMGAATAPEVDVIPGYTFAGWDSNDFVFVTQDLVISARYLETDKYAYVSLNKEVCSLVEGSSVDLTATLTPAELYDEPLTWSSENTTVADVDSTGKITAYAAGTTTITVTVDSSGETASCVVTVLADSTNRITLLSGSELNYDRLGYLRRVSQNTTTAALAAQFENSNLQFVDSGEAVLGATDFVSTGTQIRLLKNERLLDSKTVVITGDIVCDGKIDNKDIVFVMQVLTKKKTANDAQLLAMDVNGDGKVNNRDASMLARYLVGKDELKS